MGGGRSLSSHGISSPLKARISWCVSPFWWRRLLILPPNGEIVLKLQGFTNKKVDLHPLGACKITESHFGVNSKITSPVKGRICYSLPSLQFAYPKNQSLLNCVSQNFTLPLSCCHGSSGFAIKTGDIARHGILHFILDSCSVKPNTNWK